MATADLWTYRNAALTGRDLTGFKVEALDGDIGKIDEATNDVGGSYVVVDTGPWIFGKKVLIPAGLVGDVDVDAETVLLTARRTRSRTHRSSTKIATATRATAVNSAATTAKSAPDTATTSPRHAVI